MKKPRIAFLIPRLGITDRGAEIFVCELSLRLITDFDVDIFVRKFHERTEILEKLRKQGVIIEQISSVSGEHWLLTILYRSFLKKPLDIVHLNPTELEKLVFSIACIPKLCREKYAIFFPANGIWGVFACRIIRMFRKIPLIYTSLGGIEPLIAKQKPNAYIAINPGIARWLRLHFSHLVIPFIPTGVDLRKFTIKIQ